MSRIHLIDWVKSNARKLYGVPIALLAIDYTQDAVFKAIAGTGWQLVSFEVMPRIGQFPKVRPVLRWEAWRV